MGKERKDNTLGSGSSTAGSDNHTVEQVVALMEKLAEQMQAQQQQINQILDGGVGDGGDDGAEKAKVALVEHKYNTPEGKMPEMTVTPRRMVLPMVLLAAKREYLDKLQAGENPRLWPIIIRNFDQRMRSVDGKWADDAMIMASVEKKEDDARALDEGMPG